MRSTYWMSCLAVALLGAAALTASDAVSPSAGASGPVFDGPSVGPGCPTASVEGVIQAIDTDEQAFSMLADNESTLKVPIDKKTSFRIPGVRGKDARRNPLDHIEIGSLAKVTYCTTDSRILGVKVKKVKSQS